MRTNLRWWKADQQLFEEGVGGKGAGNGQEGERQREARKLLEMIGMLIILIVVIVSWVHTCVKAHQIYTLNMWTVLCVNYILKCSLKKW